MIITSCSTWDCINSFSNWLSALGTILISGLAFWLSVKDKMVNIKANLTLGLTSSPKSNVPDRRVYVLSFINIGARSVTVANHYWILPFVKGNVAFMPHMDRDLGQLCSKLPIELTDGKEGQAFFADNFFSILDHPKDFLFHQNRLMAWWRIHFFRVIVATTVGKRVKVKVFWNVRRRLWHIYKTWVAENEVA